MFSKIQTKKSMKNSWHELVELKRKLEEAEVILVGAGAGLSASAGFEYAGERFYQNFQDFAEEYGFQDMYSGGFYPYKTKEEYWAYWSRYVLINRYRNAVYPVYEELLELIEDKEYFILTTNVDHCFQKAGFDKERLFYTQGDYGVFQCSKPCHQETYDNEKVIHNMVEQQRDKKIPAELIPYCPRCGEPMSMNLRADGTFVEDEGWHRASKRYSQFLLENKDKKVLLLELGTGYNTPEIIKYPFWHMTAKWPDASYGCINLGEAAAPDGIREKSICLNDDIKVVLRQLSVVYI